ncbi:MAG: rhodanese-like domain-containing protein [Spirosomataceae bacterium]
MNVITRNQLDTLLTSPPPTYFFLDVRERSEFAEYSIGGVNIPPHEIGDHLDELKKYHDIVVFCSNGMRSSLVLRWLLKKNPDAVYWHLEEGIW